MTMTEDQRADHPLGVAVGVSPGSGSAREVVNDMLDAGLLDAVMDQVDAGALVLTGEGGFLPEMVKAVLERGLAAELTGHVGYAKGDRAGWGTPNSRNGATAKTVSTEVGDVRLDVPRDRAGSFEPRLVPKGSRRVGGLDEMIVSLYAGGMTVRDIGHHLARTLGTWAVARHHLHDHRLGVGGGQGVATPPVGGDLPDHLPRRAGGEDPRRAPGA